MSDSSFSFAGIWIPLLTPFRPDLSVDHDTLGRLVRHYASTGVAGLVVCGSTGEAHALDGPEQDAVLHTVLAHAGHLPVILGASGVTPAAVIARLQRVATLPLAGVLLSPPYYVRPSQRGIEDFFLAVADKCELPLVLYDIPARCGVRIETATMLALAGHPRIRAVKDCGGDAEHTQAIINDGRLQLLAGDDARLFTTLCQGGAGAIAASAHLRPELLVALHRAIRGNDLHAAAALWRQLWPLARALFAEPSPGPLKAALARCLDVPDTLRPPMTAASPACVAQLMAALPVA